MNVLVVGGERAEAEAVRKLLRAAPGSYAVEIATSHKAGLSVLARGETDVALVDYRLRTGSGLDFVRDARDMLPEVPVVLLSDGRRVDEVAVDRSAAAVGAVNRLERSELTPTLLGRTLRYAVSRAHRYRPADLDQVRFQAGLLAAVGQAVIATELDGTVFYWNRAAEEIYGWTPTEALGRNVRELVFPQTGMERADQIRTALRAGESWSGEYEVQRKDGSRFSAYVTNSPVLSEDGALIGILGVSSDVSEIKATESALTERVKELRTLYEAGRILAAADPSLETRLQAVVERIPPGFLYPEITEARLTLPDRRLRTAGFRETEWAITAPVDAGPGGTGRLEVVLTEPRPERDTGPFLREEQELLDNLGRMIGDGIRREVLSRTLNRTFAALDEAVVISREATIEYANPAAERIFRRGPGELIGRGLEEFLVEGTAPLEESTPILEREGVYHGSHEMRRTDGTTFHAEQSVSLIEPSQGMGGGAVAVIRDVTERFESDARLRASEERFREIARHIKSVFWIAEPDLSRMTYASPAFESIFGRPVDALLDDANVWRNAILQRDRPGATLTQPPTEPFEREYRIVRPDGEVRWILDRGYPVEEGGAVVRVIGLAEDITDRIRAEERLSLLVQEIAEGIQIIAPDGRILFATPASQALLGYPPAEVVGRNAFEFVHEQDRSEIENLLGSIALEPEAETRAQYRGVRKDGTVRYLESAARNRIDHPAIGGLVVTTRDITERRRLEEQLRQSQRLEAVGRLAGGIAHDFNNLLTVIRSETDLLTMQLDDDGSRDPAFREALDSIGSTADRAAELTKQLLAFSREQVLQPRVVNLSAIVDDASRLLRRVISEDVRLDLQLESELPAIRLDPGQLEAVIVNLAVNARDAMPGGGTLRMRTYEMDVTDGNRPEHPGQEPGRYVVLEVSDTGTGMDARTLSHLFEPFFTTKEKGRGTGLGLAMAYGFVTQSGGTIRVESEPGQGSTFRLCFPAVSEAPDTLARDEHSTESLRRITGARVLVVEDNAAVRRVAVRVLERAGVEVVARGSAEEGLGAMEAGGFDVLVTDLVLPGMSGRALFERVSELDPELPVVIMSGYEESSVGEERELPDDVLFLEKPFTPDQLVQAVREAFGSGR